MKTRIENADEYGTSKITLFMPEVADVENLAVGDMAPSCWGRLQRVAEIAYRGVDLHGAPFVGFYVEDGVNGGRMSASLKAGELVRTVPMSGGKFTSAWADRQEDDMRREFGLDKVGQGRLQAFRSRVARDAAADRGRAPFRFTGQK